jgi:hypothetical protein
MSGTWSADSYDPDGQLIPDPRAEVTARGTRISIE